MRLNLDPNITVHGGLTAHKHWMQPEPNSTEQTCGTLVLLTARNPYDWALAMHRTCYCCEARRWGGAGAGRGGRS